MVLYFVVGRFFALRDEKTTHKELNITGKRKPYLCMSFSPHRAKKRPAQGEKSRFEMHCS